MANFDENTDFIDQDDVAAMPTAIRYGGIAALAFIAQQLLVDTLGLVNYATGEGQMISSILPAIITFAVLYFAIKQHKEEDLGGFITFGRCVKLGALIGLISGVAIGIFAAVYHGFVRPDIMVDSLELQKEKMLEAGQSEEQAEMAIEMSKAMTGPVGLAILSLLSSVFWHALFSLLVGGIMKKTRPMV